MNRQSPTEVAEAACFPRVSGDKPRASKLSIQNAPEHRSGANEARGYLGTWGLYSPKLKAVPHPKLLLQLPLNALLPDVQRILSLGRY